jgi:hypothetical protein
MLPAGSPPRVHDHENSWPEFSRPSRCHRRTSIQAQDSQVIRPPRAGRAIKSPQSRYRNQLANADAANRPHKQNSRYLLVFFSFASCLTAVFYYIPAVSDGSTPRRSFRSSTPRCPVTHHVHAPSVASRCRYKAARTALASCRAPASSSFLRISSSISVARIWTTIQRSPARRRRRYACMRAAAERVGGPVLRSASRDMCASLRARSGKPAIHGARPPLRVRPVALTYR